MRGKPLVSIITPTYNHENFIGQCVESVLAQTYTNWEHIIIDDGSTDKTSEIIESYNDPRIRYIRQKHLGIWLLGETYNRALQLANGDFIAILEGDDYWPENKLEIQVPYFEGNNVVLTWGKGNLVNTAGKLIYVMSPINFCFNKNIYQNIPPGTALRKLLLKNFVIPTVTVMVKKSTLLKIGGFQQPAGIPYVDYPTWLKFSLKGEFRFINKVLGYWRRHPGQTTTILHNTLNSSHEKVTVEFCNNLPKNFKKFIRISDRIIKSRNYSRNCWLKGRDKLLNKEWQKARKELIQAVFKGSFITKMKSLAGLVVSFFHTDLEKIPKFLEKLLKL